MLTREQRTAILELARRGMGTRAIARAVGVSRGSAKEVIATGSPEAPAIVRPELASPYREEILALHRSCKGNLVRVHEELVARGAVVSYPALTAYCRRHGITTPAKEASGSHDRPPGQELQHDTSPHRLSLGGREVRVQTASAVLAYSRMLLFQCYPTFTRFECKIFLTDALTYFSGSPAVVLVDNTSVVIAYGTGSRAVPAPEMAAFGDRYGFVFRAHEVGDANRSGKVERTFHFIERNFLAGRSFADYAALNAEALAWCEKVNAAYKRHLHASPRELLATELASLNPLPVWVPEVVRLHQRIVDVEGFVKVHANRYSAPEDWIGRRVEVRETKQRLTLDLGRGAAVVHTRLIGVSDQRVTLPEHRRPRARRVGPSREVEAILAVAPELAGYVAALTRSGRRSPTLVLRQLRRMIDEYPRAPLLAAVAEAGAFGLYDLARVERMVLRRVAREYFTLQGGKDE